MKNCLGKHHAILDFKISVFKIVYTFIVLFFTCHFTIADGGDNGIKDNLTLKEALIMSLTKQYHIIQARSSVIQSKSDRLAAKSAFLPQLSVEDQPQFYQPIGKGGNTYIAGTLVPADQGFYYNSINANFKWNIFNGGKDIAELHAAEDMVASADEKKISIISTSFSKILQAYSELADIQIKINNAKEVIVANKKIVYLTQLRYKHGIASRLSLLREEQKILISQNKLQQDYGKFATDERQLLSAIGINKASNNIVHVNEYLPIPSINLNKITELAANKTPSVRSELANFNAARQQVRVATSGFYPSLSIISQYNWLGLNTNHPGVAFANTMGSNYTVGLSIKIPLLPATNVVAAVQSAQAGVENALGAYDHAVTTVMGRRMQAILVRKSANNSLSIAKHALSLANESLQLTEAKYKNGQVNAISVLDMHISVMQQKSALKRAALKKRLANWMVVRAINPVRFVNLLLSGSINHE